MKVRTNMMLACAGIVAGFASLASASSYTINWLNMAPTPFGSSVPNNSVFNWPGGGTVTINYTFPANVFTDARTQNPLFNNGTIVNGPDTYSWAAHELFGATNNVSANPIAGIPWSITYKFSNTVPNGSLYLSVAGLGQTTSFGGGATTVSVNENGSFLGDWSGGGNYGPTQFTPGNPFQMQNSLNGAGGIDPWWNSQLGVVQINNSINSLTVNFSHIPGDGAGVNVGFAAVPEPVTLAFLSLGGLLALRRRPRSA